MDIKNIDFSDLDKDQIIQLLLAQIEELKEEIRQLKAQNSKNSSKPPSSDFKKNSPPGSKNRGGAQKGHQANQRIMLDDSEVHKHVHLKSKRCPKCKNTDIIERRVTIHQVCDLKKFGLEVTNYHIYTYKCPHCKNQFKKELPKGVTLSPFGPSLQAVSIFMTGKLGLSKRQLCQAYKYLFSLHISVGAVSKIEARFAKKIKPVYEHIRKRIKSSIETSYVDETSWRNCAKSCWAWVNASKNYLFFEILPSRSKQAKDQFLGERFVHPVVTDRYSAYNNLDCPHQYCLAHVKRNLVKESEAKGLRGNIGESCLHYLQIVFEAWHEFRGGKISRKMLQNLTDPPINQLKEHLMLGAVKCSKGGNFSRFHMQLLSGFSKLWTFLTVENIDPTNNEAERSLRPLVLWRKKSFGTQSNTGMRFVESIMTVCGTLQRQGINILSFLTKVIQSEGQAPELLI